MQAAVGLSSLQDGLTIRNAQSHMLALVRLYVCEVAENEGKSDVGAGVIAALRSVYKTCNHDAGRKIRPPLQNSFLSWVQTQDKDRKFEVLLTGGPWYMSDIDVDSFMADLRAHIIKLSTDKGFNRADAWRTTMHECLLDLAKRKPSSQVCRC